MDFIDYCLLSQLFFSVRNPEGQIKLYSKGADTILFERLHPSNEDLLTLTSDHLSVSAPVVRLAQWPFSSFLWLGLFFKISAKWSDFWNRKCVENGCTGNCDNERLETGTWTHPLPCWTSGQSLQGGWIHSWWEIATEWSNQPTLVRRWLRTPRETCSDFLTAGGCSTWMTGLVLVKRNWRIAFPWVLMCLVLMYLVLLGLLPSTQGIV